MERTPTSQVTAEGRAQSGPEQFAAVRGSFPLVQAATARGNGNGAGGGSGRSLLDLFCCEGGAGEGYARAGFDVTGVDIEPQPQNPHRFIHGDAIEYLREHGHEYDVIHASPPCQSYSKALRHMASPKPMLIDAVKELMIELGKPWIIENVVGAPLANGSDLFGAHGAELCGTSFGLRVYRHRIFETSFPLPAPPPCNHSRHGMNPHSVAGRSRIYAEHGKQDPEKLWAKEMGVEWMSRHGARQAVPPAFTQWIGERLLVRLGGGGGVLVGRCAWATEKETNERLNSPTRRERRSQNTMNYQNKEERRTNPRGGLGAVNGYGLAGLGLGFVIANFAYQLMTKQEWGDAAERTWFQFMALLAVWIYGRLVGPSHNGQAEPHAGLGGPS